MFHISLDKMDYKDLYFYWIIVAGLKLNRLKNDKKKAAFLIKSSFLNSFVSFILKLVVTNHIWFNTNRI